MPDEKNASEHREFVRVEYDLPVEIETGDVVIPMTEGFLEDVSAQGAMFLSKEKLYPGLSIKLKVKLKKTQVKLYGQVIWQKKQDSIYKAGIKFDDSFSENNDKAVELIIKEIIDESKPKE